MHDPADDPPTLEQYIAGKATERAAGESNEPARPSVTILDAIADPKLFAPCDPTPGLLGAHFSPHEASELWRRLTASRWRARFATSLLL